MHHVKEYLAALFHGWVGRMSGLASVILAFLPLIWPRVFADSRATERSTWAAAAVCFLIASYSAWLREREGLESQAAEMLNRLKEKDSEIERISKPDRCPIVLVTGWNIEYVMGIGLKGAVESIPHQGSFSLQSEGETAHEISLEEFDIEPSVTVASRTVPHVVGHEIGNGTMLAWIKNRNRTDFNKWDLKSAFRHASEARDGNVIWKPNYCCTLRLTYRDHSDFWDHGHHLNEATVALRIHTFKSGCFPASQFVGILCL